MMSDHRPLDAILGRITPPNDVYPRTAVEAVLRRMVTPPELDPASGRGVDIREILGVISTSTLGGADQADLAGLAGLTENVIGRDGVGDDLIQDQTQLASRPGQDLAGHTLNERPIQVLGDFARGDFACHAKPIAKVHGLHEQKRPDQIFECVKVRLGGEFSIAHTPTLSQNRLANQTALRP